MPKRKCESTSNCFAKTWLCEFCVGFFSRYYLIITICTEYKHVARAYGGLQKICIKSYLQKKASYLRIHFWDFDAIYEIQFPPQFCNRARAVAKISKPWRGADRRQWNYWQLGQTKSYVKQKPITIHIFLSFPSFSFVWCIPFFGFCRL